MLGDVTRGTAIAGDARMLGGGDEVTTHSDINYAKAF
jgi:hypothetical protein